MKRKLGVGWISLVCVSLVLVIAYVALGDYLTSTYGTKDTKVNAILRINELLDGTGKDTLKGVAAGTTGAIDIDGYDQFATYLQVYEHDADTGCITLAAQVSADYSNWVTAMTDTHRTADSSIGVTTWTLPPALYVRFIYTGMQNTVDSTKVGDMYHLFQQ